MAFNSVVGNEVDVVDHLVSLLQPGPRSELGRIVHRPAVELPPKSSKLVSLRLIWRDLLVGLVLDDPKEHHRSDDSCDALDEVFLRLVHYVSFRSHYNPCKYSDLKERALVKGAQSFRTMGSESGNIA